MDSSKTPLEQQKASNAEVMTLELENGIKVSENEKPAVVMIEVEKIKSTEGMVHTKIRRDRVSIRTLNNYNIKHYIDEVPEFIVITRDVPGYELEFLKRHTQELRKTKIDQAAEGPHGLPSPPLGPERSPLLAPSDKPGPKSELGLNTQVVPAPPENLSAQSDPSSTSSLWRKPDLLLTPNYVPFEKWLDRSNNTTRGESVLDIAMQRKTGSEPKSTTKAGDPSQSVSSSNIQESRDESTIPVRLAINSNHIKFQLAHITKHSFNRNVMHPPWKVIINYEEQIRKRLEELETRAEKQAAEEVSKENDDASSVLSSIIDASIENDKNAVTQPNNQSPVSTYRGVPSPEPAGRPGPPGPSGPPTLVVTGPFGPPRPPSVPQCETCQEPYFSDEHLNKLDCFKGAIEHFRCFINFIDTDLKYVFSLRQGLADGTVKDIAFEDLWHLFSPGDLIITAGLKRARCAYKVYFTSGGRPTPNRDQNGFEKKPYTTPFKIDCFYIGYDTTRDGWDHFDKPFISHGLRYTSKIASVFPIQYLKDHETIMEELVKRGKRLRQLTPFAHKRYTGPSSGQGPEYLNSEIIIDLRKYADIPDLGELGSIHSSLGDEVAEGCTFNGPCYGCFDIFDDAVVDRDRAAHYKEDSYLLSVRDVDDDNITDEHFMLLPPDIGAFVLRERDMFGIYIDLVSDLDGDHGESLPTLKKKSGFQDLVLPEGHGDLVEALVRTHRSTAKPVDGIEPEKVRVDLIDGKGEGLVILLHGVPSVSKTSTAECVAAYTGRPLYPITCANIGLDPAVVEKNLTGPAGHFRRAQQWNCVVLLDEADVFLAKRETRDNDAKRNALVSVFLRCLEYYSGILILTTNRVGSFDEAVVSRIQLFLYYPPLDKDQTMKVWRVHINRVRASGLIDLHREDEAMIMDFAKEEYAEGRRWNGRQIRNFFQTAISLASYDATKWHQESIEEGAADKDSKSEKPRLTTRTLKTVAATTGKFIDYINATVPDGSHQKQQLDEGNRNDSWEETPKKKK